MQTKFISAGLLLTLGLAAALRADDVTKIEIQNKPTLWQVTLSDSSKAVIALQNIVAVAMHPYLLNGVSLVSEVTVDTVGNNTIRFYYLHGEVSDGIDSAAQNAIANARKSASRVVGRKKRETEVPSVKFPEGTYGHSIEYQVSASDDLDKIYNSLLAALSGISEKNMKNLKLDK